jgi:hypothetical protein
MCSGNDRLCIVVFDFSGSMLNPPLILDSRDSKECNELEYSISSLSMAKLAFVNAIKNSKLIGHPDNTYVALIGFSGDARFLGIIKISEVSNDFKYWENWFDDNILDIKYTFGEESNITSALELARQIYNDALKGDLSIYGINNFSLEFAPTHINDSMYPIGRIRVLVCSDGNFDENSYVNYFSDASINPYLINVNGLISIFCGHRDQDYINTTGYMNMETLAGVCPIHGIKGVMPINGSLKQHDEITKLFTRVFSGCGFCPECIRHK